MSALFDEVRTTISVDQTPILALHNGVVDQVVVHSIDTYDLAARLKRGEQRFRASSISLRLGGGGINFALSASAIGHPNVAFAGFLDNLAFDLLQKLKERYSLDLECLRLPSEERTNVVFEPCGLTGRSAGKGNFLFGVKSSEYDFAPLLDIIRSRAIPADGWIASCSFNPDISLPLLGRTANYILDSGYSSERSERKYASKLIDDLRKKKHLLKTVILAANEAEVIKIAEEFGGVYRSRFDAAKFIVDTILQESGVSVLMLLHTSRYSSLIYPGQIDVWAVPAYALDSSQILRLTNAGDTMLGAFAAAYGATKDPKSSILFSHAAVACRLRYDELPTREKFDEFVSRHSLREGKIPGATVVVPTSVSKACSALRKAARV
ncbi:MAG: hypothetical protein ACP5N9_03790 [Candidatus Bilamarchaeum sp.]|jgi:sugar/nucleoside kinase (ribokinase family)